MKPLKRISSRQVGGVLSSLVLTVILVMMMSMSVFADVTVTKSWDDNLSGSSASTRGTPSVNLEGTTSYEQLLNLMYPVGSCYFSLDASFNPNTAWGGTWEKLSDGVFFQSTQIASDVGTSVDAGLPNITGTWTTSWNQNVRGFHNLTCSGAFYRNTDTGRPGRITSEDGYANNSPTNGYPCFDASLANPIYGNSTTVQPPAIKGYIWRRTA